jgi:hypothetical protein
MWLFRGRNEQTLFVELSKDSFMHGVPVVEAMYSPITSAHACYAATGREAQATPDFQLKA